MPSLWVIFLLTFLAGIPWWLCLLMMYDCLPRRHNKDPTDN